MCRGTLKVLLKLLKLLCLSVIALFACETIWNVMEGTVRNKINGLKLTYGTKRNETAGDSRDSTKHGVDAGSRKGTKHGVDAGGSVDVMINTYMRSGSSFLGRVLGFRTDTFYVYEPLWSISRNEYFISDNQSCGTFRPYCKKSQELRTAFKALNQLYDCTFYTEPMLKILRPNINVKLSGDRWQVFKKCKAERKSDTTCLTAMATKVCATSTNKVTKVLRISLSNIKSFLQSRPNMKVVHLFRDPRAMINSHMRTGWSPVRERSLVSIEAAAKSICQRIGDDLKYVEVLRNDSPERFITLQYEDFTETLPKIQKLLRFLGMDSTNEVSKFIDKSNKPGGPGNHPFMYREQLEWRAVEIINKHCTNEFEKLGYIMFTSEKTFRNLSIPAVISPLPFALL